MLFRSLRRRRLRRQPFPAEWTDFIEQHLSSWALLSADEQQTMRERVRFFIAERYWEGCAGLTVTDEMRVAIAANASLLVLARPEDEYDNVTTILVYPSGYFAPDQPPSVLGGTRLIAASPQAVLGQAHQNGPVILSWRHARFGTAHAGDGENVVLHEFAHKLDMLAGGVDGTPRMESREQAAEWATVMQRSLEELRAEIAAGVPTLIRRYGATNPAEFFAVTTELFFELPLPLRERHPDLYRVLRRYYRQDPAARELARPGPQARPEADSPQPLRDESPNGRS